MKKAMFRVLAVALIVAFTLPAAACGVIDKATNAVTKAQKQVTRPAKNKQTARPAKRQQTQKKAGKQAKPGQQLKAQGKKGNQGLKAQQGNKKQRVEQKIARLAKVKAAIEKDGKTADPVYKKICDRLERLKTGPPKKNG